MCPQLPRLSPEYSHKVGFQTVITGMPLQIRPVTRGGHAGPVTMGRNARGPLSWTRPHYGMTSSPVFVWCRSSEGCPCLFCPCLTSGSQRRLRARGGAFAFAPTGAFDGRNLTTASFQCKLLVCDLCLLNLVISELSCLSGVLGTLGRILFGYFVHMHICLRSLR